MVVLSVVRNKTLLTWFYYQCLSSSPQENVQKQIDLSDKKLNELLSGGEDDTLHRNNLILFLKDVEEFVGLDGEGIGPFESGQMANIPKEIAKILVEDKKAEYVIE